MSTQLWKLEKDLCRCCHSEGAFRNINAQHVWLDIEEVYSDMLRECFDIELTAVTELLNQVVCAICDACIQRLRDATEFKHQVLNCERRFRDLYLRHVGKDTAFELKIKKEVPDSEDNDDIKVDIFSHNGSRIENSRNTIADDEKMSDDDFGVSDHGDDDDFKPDDEEEEILDRVKKKTKHKKAKMASSKVKKKKTSRPRKSAAPPTDEIVDTIEDAQVEEYIAQQLGKDKTYKCKACEIPFRRIYDLRYHIIRSHLKRKVIECLLCAETFMYHSHRKSHMYTAHEFQKPDQFQCDLCYRKFRRKNTLAQHMLDVHVGKKCEFCELEFPRKKLPFHMNDAHDVPMPTCGVCGLRTLLQSSLVRHQRNVHLNEKDKLCTVCSKRFYSESNLKDHMACHSGSKAFKCDVCAKAFARKECYRAHCKRKHGKL